MIPSDLYFATHVCAHLNSSFQLAPTNGKRSTRYPHVRCPYVLDVLFTIHFYDRETLNRMFQDTVNLCENFHSGFQGIFSVGYSVSTITKSCPTIVLGACLVVCASGFIFQRELEDLCVIHMICPMQLTKYNRYRSQELFKQKI